MYFDSPMELCPRCKTYVLLDQSQKECAAEHRCGEVNCPLARYFSGRNFDTAEAGDARQARNSADAQDSAAAERSYESRLRTEKERNS